MAATDGSAESTDPGATETRSTLREVAGRQAGLLRTVLPWVAALLAGISATVSYLVDGRHPYGPLQFLFEFPWVLLAMAGSLVFSICMFWLFFLSDFGERHQVFERYVDFWLGGIVILGGAGLEIYLWISWWILATPPVSVVAQVPLAVGAVLLCAIGLTTLARRGRQNLVVELAHDYGTRLTATAFVVIVAGTSVVVFGFLTYLLNDWGVLPTDREANTADLDIWTACLFYIYQLVRALPVVNLADAYGWEAPFTSESPLLGTAIVLFKLAVIVPVIKLIQILWVGRPSNAQTPEDELQTHDT